MNPFADILSDLPEQGSGWSLDLPASDHKDIFADKKRKHWANAGDQRCDFESYPGIQRRGGQFFAFLWKRSVKGVLLSDIKQQQEYVDKFAFRALEFLTDYISDDLSRGGWALVTSPRRRHLQRNFADEVCNRLAQLAKIKYYQDCAICHSRQRLDAVFTPNNIPNEDNIIVFDDIVTTGSTLKSMRALLKPLGKNLMFIVGINNVL